MIKFFAAIIVFVWVVLIIKRGHDEVFCILFTITIDVHFYKLKKSVRKIYLLLSFYISYKFINNAIFNKENSRNHNQSDVMQPGPNTVTRLN